MRWLLVCLLAACGARPRAPAGDPETRFGPLEVGADYATYRKLTPQPFLSKAHGDRWVDVWVPEAAADAYLSGDEIPAGTVVVKTSRLQDGRPGPIYVMKKGAPGSDPSREDWWYAIHWAEWDKGPIYWRGQSPRIAYCWNKCHDNYDRGLGGLTPSSLVPR